MCWQTKDVSCCCVCLQVRKLRVEPNEELQLRQALRNMESRRVSAEQCAGIRMAVVGKAPCARCSQGTAPQAAATQGQQQCCRLFRSVHVNGDLGNRVICALAGCCRCFDVCTQRPVAAVAAVACLRRGARLRRWHDAGGAGAGAAIESADEAGAANGSRWVAAVAVVGASSSTASALHLLDNR